MAGVGDEGVELRGELEGGWMNLVKLDKREVTLLLKKGVDGVCQCCRRWVSECIGLQRRKELLYGEVMSPLLSHLSSWLDTESYVGIDL